MKKSIKKVILCTAVCMLAGITGCGSGSPKEMNAEELEKLEDSIRAYVDVSDFSDEGDLVKYVKKADKEIVWGYMKEIIQEELTDPYVSDLSMSVLIRECESLYERAFEELHPDLAKCVEWEDDLTATYRAKKELKEKYPYSLEGAAQNYKYADVYITNRFNMGYDDNIIGKIQKEVDSYIASEDSYWSAFNVVSDFFLGQIRGDEKYVVYSQELNPFTESGVHTIAYYTDGTTLTLENAGGFQTEAPVLYLINELQIKEDYGKYLEYENKSYEILKELGQLNGVEVPMEETSSDIAYEDSTDEESVVEGSEFQTTAQTSGMVTVNDIINAQWAMTPNEEYSFTITGPENDLVLEIFETGNPDNIRLRGYAKMVTATEMADLYMTFGFGHDAEVAVVWHNMESIDYPSVESLNETWTDYAGDYHYYGMITE